ncbi:MAG: DNA polymerase III subunit delta [Verrucomicrobiia bacterium]|jgi:DNA polymerase-3 subunit delta
MSEGKKDFPGLVLVYGSDDFLVKNRARTIFNQWSERSNSVDCEVIEGNVENQDAAQKAISRLIESLNTPPFFGSLRVIWLKDCNFFANNSQVSGEKLRDRIDNLAQTIKQTRWQDVRLLISARDVDKRRAIYKVISEKGKIENYEALSLQDPDWERKAIDYVDQIFEQNNKKVSQEVLTELVNRIGPDLAILNSEAEKLIIYTADRAQITLDDVNAICSNNVLARAFAVADALGRRDLPSVLKHLDEEFWSMQFDKEKSEIGILYGIISKVRALLVAKELVQERLINPDLKYPVFKSALESSSLKTISNVKIHPFVLYKACEESKNFTHKELVNAMLLLLKCNQDLVTTQQDKKRLIQQTLIKILSKAA